MMTMMTISIHLPVLLPVALSSNSRLRVCSSSSCLEEQDLKAEDAQGRLDEYDEAENDRKFYELLSLDFRPNSDVSHKLRQLLARTQRVGLFRADVKDDS